MEDNCSSLQPAWTFRPAFNGSWWFPDTFAHETETITRALQICLSTDAISTDDFPSAGSRPSPLVDTATPASDAETVQRRTRSPALSPPSGRVSKRKPRASNSKRSTTTFIAADPANFPQMVQQATGIPFGRTHGAPKAVPRREPRRPGKGLAMEGSFPPTLDTSAFLLEQEQAGEGGFAPAASTPGSQGFFGSSPEVSGFDIHDPPFPSFPTLESSYM